jgi:hypothetical protein
MNDPYAEIYLLKVYKSFLGMVACLHNSEQF